MEKTTSYFNNNEGIGGFEIGEYDLQAHHPADANWTRQSRFIIPCKPKMIWKACIENRYVDSTGIHSSLVVDKMGNIVLSDCDNNLVGKHSGRIIKISPTGDLKEVFKMDFRLKSPIIGYNDILFFTTSGTLDSDGNKLFCLSSDGDVKWEYIIENPAYSMPIIDNTGNIYIYTYGKKVGTLLSIGNNGILNWKREFNSVNWFEPIISMDGIIFLGLNVDHKLYAIDKNGQILWSLVLGQGLGLYPPVIKNDGTIYICLSGNLLALSPNGEIIWKYKPLKGTVITPPALSKEGSLMLNLTALRIISLDCNGKELWENQIKGSTSVPPIIDRAGNLYQQSYLPYSHQDNSWIESFSKSGDMLWTYKLKGVIVSTVLADDNLIYALVNHYTGTAKGWLDKMLTKWELYAIGM